MDDYAGRVLADRYRLPVPPADAYDLVETRAFDTYSGQEVRIRQVPLPEVVDAELVGEEPYTAPGRATRRPADPAVRRALEAAQAAAQIPDHPRLDQVFDVFAEAGSLWIVSEFLPATPLSELLAEAPLSPYRAAEIGSDLLTALRALHAHGWTHRNVTPRTVLVCDDGRVVLTGLAAGAAEEALCGYAPVPFPDDEELSFGPRPSAGAVDAVDAAGAADAADDLHYAEYADHAEEDGDFGDSGEHDPYEGGAAYERHETYDDRDANDADEYVTVYPPAHEGGYGDVYEADASAREGVAADHRAELYAPADTWQPEPAREAPREPADFYGPEPAGTPYGPGRGEGARSEAPAAPPLPGTPSAADVRAARAGAIAAYRAGARAAARLGETGALPVQRPAAPAPEPAPEAPTDAPAGPAPETAARPAAQPPAPPVAPAAHPSPQWWARTEADEDDEDDEDDDDRGDGGAAPPARAYLAGTWSDGPHASRDGGGRSVPAGGGGLPALPAGYTAAVPAPAPVPSPAGPAGGVPAYRGPVTRLAAERARQARMAVVGPVTERWAPEQAGPVHEHWRLAPPIGPATDLWALGALLYRAVQGHAPYPEDSAAELVQLVCAEPPAFAEECGPLRPVVESLLHQDPTERPDVEVLSGWLRSLVRSAPEPEAGLDAVPLLPPDAARLPIVRRRGELVRRRRGGAAGGRHRHAKGAVPRQGRRPDEAAAGPAGPEAHAGHEAADLRQPEYRDEHRGDSRGEHRGEHRGDFRGEYGGDFRDDLLRDSFHEEIPQRPARAAKAPRSAGSPRSLGRILLLLVLLLLGGAVAYAMVVMPGKGEGKAPAAAPSGSTAPSASGKPPSPAPTTPSGAPSTAPPRTTAPPPGTGAALAPGYAVRKDPEGFEVGVPRDWRRSPINDAGQVRYTGGDFTLIVVPGRDTVQANGSDPMAYQRTKERELQPWRDSSWSSASGLRRIDIGRQAMAVGQFTWQDSTGREVFVRNLALIEGGRYHVVQVIGPENERDKVSEIYDQAVKAYRATR
ncbi:protein kinase [Streptomyces sp. NPDC048659]|uniref:protein kinase n=1 Tax=Streptomyces sp. NPDC048659 TaxID=3155489 RepID=UPI0034215DCF